MSSQIDSYSLAVVIPAYNAATSIRSVILSLPVYVERIIIVDDGSADRTREAVQALDDPRIVLLCHERNQGVGGAMVTGFKAALTAGVDLVAKIDADGQMAPDYLENMARLAVEQKYDYVKANRFQKSGSLPEMPPVRLVGNLILTFLTRMASGFREISDPQNGYLLITRNMLSRLPLDRIDRGYFFENSMLIELNILGGSVGEMYVPARYGGEMSSLRISRIIWTFPPKLIGGFVSRIIRKYVIPRQINRGGGDPMNMDTVRRFYNEVYYRDVPLPGTISLHYRRLAQRMDVSGGHRVLDVGCGTAEWLRAVHNQGAIPLGIDLSQRALVIGRTSLHDGILLVGCAENLPFGTGQFDLVTCLGSLEHFMDMKQALLEMVRVARDDARILILVPNAGFLTRRLGFYRGTIQSDMREVTMNIDQWKKVFEEAGLHVKKRWRDLHILSWRWISLSKAWHIPFRALQAAALIFWPLRWQFQVYHLCEKKRLSGAE